MTVEATSAGAILFRDTRGEREYLLPEEPTGDWEFPKGGIEGDEELQQTAIRGRCRRRPESKISG